MTLTEAIVFFKLSSEVSVHERRDISRILEAMRLTEAEAEDADAWQAAAEELLREDEDFELMFRPAAVASVEAVLVN